MVDPIDDSHTISNRLSSNMSLQAYVELEYVRTGNQVMVSQMQSLENSLGVITVAMDTLTRIQDLHNMVTVEGKGRFDVNYSTVSVAEYTKAASAFFGNPVQIKYDFGAGGFNGFHSQINSVLTTLDNIIPRLSAVTPKLTGGGEDSNSLLAKMRIVKNDIISSNAHTNETGAENWLHDKNNVNAGSAIASAGIYQQGITNAITAGQSMNTTQTEAVRNFLYIYEEYYKSASAVLQQITQIIQKMAGGISNG